MNHRLAKPHLLVGKSFEELVQEEQDLLNWLAEQLTQMKLVFRSYLRPI